MYCNANDKLMEINAFVRKVVHIGDNTCTKHLSQHQEERDHLGVEGRITLEWVLRKCTVYELLTGPVRHRTGAGDGLMWLL